MTDIYLLYSTFPNRSEAIFIAGKLLEKRLVACANVHDGVTSLYRWEGEMRQESEAVMVAKTSAGQLAAAMECIKSHHSYDVPCITAWPVEKGFPPFLKWVADETP
jgi:periplasmic divalent cation tolerance protein